VIVPNPAFRPNPSRAIYIQGVIEPRLVAELTPQIIKLTNESREPITVYIDSKGGSVASAELLLRLLTASNQDMAPPCWLITVVTSWAASAAADLLSSGNYAIAYPESTILYHGVRSSFNDPLTVEVASYLAESLKLSNDRYAMALARKSEWRFMYRFMTMRSEFDTFRTKSKQAGMSDLDCFLALTGEKLSKNAKKIVEQAKSRHQRYSALLTHVLKFAMRSKRVSTGTRAAENESVIIRGIITFELKSNKDNPGWTFGDGGLSRLSDDFFLLKEYLESAQSEQFRSICERWSPFVLSKSELDQLEAMPADEKAAQRLAIVQPHFQPLWSFFVALCHALQEGENELTATDAFWLGLLDEIIGTQDLPLLRYLQEFQADPEPAQLQDGEPPVRESATSQAPKSSSK
jgi:ATP-dependent protease ClpP protease subunit